MRLKAAYFNDLARCPVDDLLGRFTLIVGEVNSGKTTLSAILLERFLRFTQRTMVVVDLAPAFAGPGGQPRMAGKPVGGALQIPADDRVDYRRVSLAAPRLEQADETLRAALACSNARRIEGVFASLFAQRPVDILFVNDCSLYLQGGRKERLLAWIEAAATAVVNGYFGHRLGHGPLSRREREAMKELMGQCDRVVRLEPITGSGTSQSIPN